MALLNSECPNLKLLARGKVRDLYDIDEKSLLFVATDRISAFDVIMKNSIPGKGKILTEISLFWFDLLKDVLPNHLITADFNKMPAQVQEYREQLEGRSILVKKMKVLPIEAIVRGYITGSGLSEYKKKGTICDIPLPEGLVDSQKLPQVLFTPSTKAEIGDHDENIHPSKMVEILKSQALADQVAQAAVELYSKASEYAARKGIIIADTKFEFGLDENNQLVLVDEVLTPDSSRFWPAAKYEAGRTQDSFDKQFLRNYLESIDFDKKTSIELPSEVTQNTLEKYKEAFFLLTGKHFTS
ncbi:phosphoribosylaminoimidazole-succinocarboxamide synthase [Sporodiniella umbellata]|nr:phosphoribosylaminoimidazole-succinocarboxamide synthase [Sporodiniella umbellata]